MGFDSPGVGEDQLALIGVQWHSATFCDYFLRVVKEVGLSSNYGPEGTCGRRRVCFVLAELCKLAYDSVGMSEDFLKSLPEARQLPLQSLIVLDQKVCRGLLTLCYPVPGVCSFSLKDALHVCPPNGTAADVFKELPRLGRLIATRRAAGWEELMVAFKSHAGPEATYGPALRSCHEMCPALVHTMSHGNVPGDFSERAAGAIDTALAGWGDRRTN